MGPMNEEEGDRYRDELTEWTEIDRRDIANRHRRTGRGDQKQRHAEQIKRPENLAVSLSSS